MASSSKGGGGGGGAGGSSPANSSSTIYPASFIKRNLVPGADSYRQTLTALRDMDKVRWTLGCGWVLEGGFGCGWRGKGHTAVEGTQDCRTAMLMGQPTDDKGFSCQRNCTQCSLCG